MKFRTLAIATAFATTMGTAAVQAENMTTDRDHLNAYSTMTYGDIYLSGGEKAAAAVSRSGQLDHPPEGLRLQRQPHCQHHLPRRYLRCQLGRQLECPLLRHGRKSQP